MLLICMQALSGVLTLLTMSKTMLDLVLQLGGLRLVLELLAYEAHPCDNDDDVAVRTLETIFCFSVFMRPAAII